LELGQPIEKASFFFSKYGMSSMKLMSKRQNMLSPAVTTTNQAQGMLIPSLVFYSAQISVFLIE
jgi:hypothetical protein